MQSEELIGRAAVAMCKQAGFYPYERMPNDGPRWKYYVDGARAALEAALSAAEQETLQDRVHPWMMACFGPEISADKLERGDRLLEEVFELLQSGNYPRERIRALEDYTYSRDKGEPSQEVGGVMITLAAYCLAHGLNMHEAGEAELARIWTKVDKIRAKQAAKPTGSALPVAVPAPSAQVQDVAKPKRTHKLSLSDHDIKMMSEGTMIIGGAQMEMAREIIFLRSLLPSAPAKQEGCESKPVHKPTVDSGESGDE